MKATFKLIAKYFIKGFGGPFFIFFFPFLIILIIGEANIMTTYDNLLNIGTPLDKVGETVGSNLRSLIGGVVTSSLIIISFLQLPGTIIEFKNSVLLKRIGATRLKIWQFFIVLIIFYLILTIIAVLYIVLISGLLFATRLTKINNPWQYVLPYIPYLGQVLGYFFLLFTVMVLFGLAIASVVKKQTTSQLITTFLFFPTSFLVGGFAPVYLVNKSEVLTSLRYIFPHSLPAVGLSTYWSGPTKDFPIGKDFDILISTSIGLAIGLICLFLFLIFKYFKWNE